MGPSLSIGPGAVGVGGKEGSRLTGGFSVGDGGLRTGGILGFRWADGGTVTCGDATTGASLVTFDIRGIEDFIVGDGLEGPAGMEVENFK